VKPFSVNATMRTGGAGRPFGHDLHFSSAPGFQIAASHGPPDRIERQDQLALPA
jgi:hypothetical protein